jgi:putative FmdB family regulatory protein
MPTYQYRCTDCGHDLEAVQKFSDAALTECPNCGGSLRKVFNAVGVVFKGSGFYRTDSRSTNGGGDGSSGGGDGKDKGDGKDSSPAKEKKDAKEPAAAKATNGSGSGGSSGKQPAAAGASSTGSSSST